MLRNNAIKISIASLVAIISGCGLFKGYNLDCKSIESIEVEVVHFEDASIPRTNRIITNKDSIKTIIKKYINTSHKVSILKTRLKYRIQIHYYGLSDPTWIGVTGKYIKCGDGWYKMRRDLEEYFKSKK